MLIIDPNAANSHEQIILLDDSDQADALGYHERTAGEVPIGFVFVKTAQAADEPWSITLSHELLEQLADPFVNLMVQGAWKGRPALIAFENCDPVEYDAYRVNDIPVSNFVTPAWFLGDNPRPPADSRFDFLGKLKAPLTLSPGGYLSFATVVGRWQQAFGQQAEAVGSFNRYRRRHRRAMRKRDEG